MVFTRWFNHLPLRIIRLRSASNIQVLLSLAADDIFDEPVVEHAAIKPVLQNNAAMLAMPNSLRFISVISETSHDEIYKASIPCCILDMQLRVK